MKTTRTCQQTDCTETTVNEYCAFHHLALVSGPDLFSGTMEAVGGLDGDALLAVIFDVLDEPVPDLICDHDALFGACYLTDMAEFPGLSRTPWELRAATYSLGIPLN